MHEYCRTVPYEPRLLCMVDLARKRDRERLQPRREPYWQQLDKGAHLGFRRGPNTWIAKFRGRDGKRHYTQLGEGLEYTKAKEKAEDWLSQLSGSPVRSVKRDTVIAALLAYVADLRRHGRHAAADKAEGQFKTVLGFDAKEERYKDGLADLELETATKDDFLDWRSRIEPNRLPRTVNRYVRTVQAGLNRAHELGHLGSPAVWRMQSLTDDDESETAIFLTALQRKQLKDAAKSEAAAFLQGLEISGGRPGELAAARGADFDGKRLKLSHRKGRPPKLRSRSVVLDEEGVKFFTLQAQGKPPTAYLFTTPKGKPWRRDEWADAVRAAIAAHNKEATGETIIPTQASAYSFRHARISELLQLYAVDPITVAAQTGTSVRMIERTYFKFIESAMLRRLATLRATTTDQEGQQSTRE
jgi:integrase